MDVQNVHGDVFNTRALRLTLNKVESRARREGLGFLTKTLPRLGKAFDKALAGETPLNAEELRMDPQPDSQLPRFLGELFNRVLQPNGVLLCAPCAKCVESIRGILFVFYKLEVPYDPVQEHEVISKFEKTETDLKAIDEILTQMQGAPQLATLLRSTSYSAGKTTLEIAHLAKSRLAELFARFDPTDIYPRHGPGAVSTKERLWDKYLWTNVDDRITERYPFDEYFCSSSGHVCDQYRDFGRVTGESLPARVILVPKDSRGPRLISCEPVDHQWIQQGLGRAIVDHVERHVLTKHNVFFTDQGPNRRGAELGSLKAPNSPTTGRYSTLDLNEASDRVSLELVRLLFPSWLFSHLEACRSTGTVLPDGRVLNLRKFAPMGSALCFPVLALTIWAILTAGAPDAYTRKRILVYGDDVIVPTAHAADAIEQLESFGLKVNRDKSCTKGLFRESCGMDAFNGINVTPVRLRTVWSSSRSAETYTSYISYANSFYDKSYYRTYNLIVSWLLSVYTEVPSEDMGLTCPSLRYVPPESRPRRRRTNTDLQKVQYRVYDIRSPSITKEIDGWAMLLRYFSENCGRPETSQEGHNRAPHHPLQDGSEFCVSTYTSRKTSMLVKRWR
jgi:hypothetical protein